jgi:Fur family ferric uptake transcriptional regulator
LQARRHVVAAHRVSGIRKALRKPLAFHRAGQLQFPAMSRKARVSAAMVDLMQDGERHAWTLEEFHAEIGRRGRKTDFSSVFRAAEKLAADGLVRKVLLDDGRTRFELVGSHHDHLYCTRCHEFVPVPCVIERAHFAAVERATGAAILDHHLVLRGLCRDCRKAGRDSEEPA